MSTDKNKTFKRAHDFELGFWRIPTKLYFLTYFLISSMVLIVLYTVSTLDKNQKHDANLIYLAGKQRMLTQQLSKNLMELQLGDNNKIAEINQVKLEFSSVLDSLESGDLSLALDAKETEDVLDSFNEIQEVWVPFIFHVELIIQNWPEINDRLENVVINSEKLFNRANSILSEISDAVNSETMVTAGTLGAHIQGTAKNIFLYARYKNEKYLLEGLKIITLSERIVKGLLDGDKELGLIKIKSESSRVKLREFKQQLTEHNKNVKLVFDKLPTVLAASTYIAENNIELLNAMNKAVKELANQSHQKVVTMIHNEYKFLAILFILGTGLSFLIIRNITKPLQMITKLMEDVSKGEILQDQIPVARKDEVGRLRNSFNRLVDSLAHLIKILNEMTAGDLSNMGQLRRGDIEKAICRLIASRNL